MTNAYCDLATLKSAGALNINGSLYDRRLLALVEEASRQIDGYCNRHFYVVHATRRFEAKGWSVGLQQLLVPDLVDAESVRVAPGFDGLGREPQWQNADYRLYPLDASPDRPWGRPYTRMAIDARWGAFCRQHDCQALVEVVGRWGYRQVLADTGAVVAAGGMTSGDTVMQVAADSGISAGQTLLVDREQVYVSAVDGAQATVARGVNGTVAAGHTAGATIGVYRYPGPVTEACLQQAMQLWRLRERREGNTGRKGRETGKAGGLTREVEALLAAYRKLAV